PARTQRRKHDGCRRGTIESTTGRLALLKEAIPNLARIGIIGNSGNYGTPAYLEKCHAWAQTVGATLQIYDLRDPNDTAPIFTKLAGDRVEALIAFPDSVIFGSATTSSRRLCGAACQASTCTASG